MPRIYDSCSDPIDLCIRCFPKTEEEAFAKYGNRGDGPDNRGNCFGYDCDHPPYDQENYRCDRCDKKLTGRDDLSLADLKAEREYRLNERARRERY